MKYVYINLDLTTGNNDGTTEANAYQTWAAFIAGEAVTFTDDVTYYVRSLGVEDSAHYFITSDGFNPNGYSWSMIGLDDCTLYYSPTYNEVLITDMVGGTFENITLKGGRYGAKDTGGSNTYKKVIAIDCDSSGLYFEGNTGSGNANYYAGCSGINCGGYGIDISGWRYATLLDCYCGGNSSGGISQDANAVVTLINTATSDTSGSSGLQNVALSTANFTNVTSGSYDFHLVSGSTLIDAGSDFTSYYTTDIEGTAYVTTDIGPYAYISSGGGTDNLYSQDVVSGTPSLEQSTIGQVHILSSQNILSGTPFVGQPTLGQVHVFDSQDIISGVPILEQSTLSQIHGLLSQDIISGIPRIREVYSGGSGILGILPRFRKLFLKFKWRSS